jgi:uncharacterized integral membrane protein
MLIRTGWEYRKLIALAVALGVLLWFIVVNNTPVTVTLPFWLGSFGTSSGKAILLGAMAGSVVTGLSIAVFLTVRRHRRPEPEAGSGESPGSLPEDLPPSDYGAKTGEGFSGAPWSAR